MHKHLSCALSRLSSSEAVAIVRVSGCLPGLHPIHLYWLRTRMTAVPFAAVSGDRPRSISASLQALLNPREPFSFHGRALPEPGSWEMKVSLNCSCHGSWPALGRIAL